MQKNQQEAGFSVLEAIIAMAILSIALLPILSLQGQFVRNVSTIERLESRLSVERSVRDHIGALNLSLVQSGAYNAPAGAVQWQAKPAGEGRRVKTAGGQPGRFIVQLYTVDVSVTYQSGSAEIFVLTGIGWKPLFPYLQGL